MAFDDLLDLLHDSEKAGEVNLTVVLQGDFGEHGQRLAELADIDQRGIAFDVALRLQFLDPHQARARRQMHKISQFHIGDAAVLLQFVKNSDVDPIQFHGRLRGTHATA
jgi:hypothetical protein